MRDATEFASKLIAPYSARIEELEEELGEIVRCGECRYRFAGYDPDYDVHLSACDRFGISHVEAEDYCAWGERGDAE